MGMFSGNPMFGQAVAPLGDLDGDMRGDIAVGSINDPNCGEGAVWILFLNFDGTVKAYHKIDKDEPDLLGDVLPGTGLGSTGSWLSTALRSC